MPSAGFEIAILAMNRLQNRTVSAHSLILIFRKPANLLSADDGLKFG
jgi:hypothetical protein